MRPDPLLVLLGLGDKVFARLVAFTLPWLSRSQQLCQSSMPTRRRGEYRTLTCDLGASHLGPHSQCESDGHSFTWSNPGVSAYVSGYEDGLKDAATRRELLGRGR